MLPSIHSFLIPILIIAILVSKARLKWTWLLFATSQVFGATSFLALPALGGAALIAPQFGLILLMVAAFSVGSKDARTTREAFTANAVGLAFVGYSILMSFFGPRLFAHQIDLVAMRPEMLAGFAIATPLEPRPTNLTQTTYMAGSFATAIVVYMIFRRKLSAADFQTGVLALGALHIFFGVVDAIGVAAGQGRVLDFLRNAGYAMTDQSLGDINRLSGSLAEPSAYAILAVPLAAFATEEWMRSRKPAPGIIGVLLWIMTFASTSSTGIVSAAFYLIIAAPRFMFGPSSFIQKAAVAAALAGVVLLASAFYLNHPDLLAENLDLLAGLTVNKAGSDSAVERAAWSLQGWSAFLKSYGLGVGPGSFRSSNFALAVLGSVGVIGSTLFLVYLAQVTHVFGFKRLEPTQKSACIAALFTLAPAMLSGATPDPGFVFGMFAGYSLLKPRRYGVAVGVAPAGAERLQPHPL